MYSHLRCGDALCQDDRVEAIGEGTARCEQHAHVRLDASDIDRVDVLEAEESAEFRFEKRVEGMLLDDHGTLSRRELLNRLDEVGSPTAGMASVVPALRITQEKRRAYSRIQGRRRPARRRL